MPAEHMLALLDENTSPDTKKRIVERVLDMKCSFRSEYYPDELVCTPDFQAEDDRSAAGVDVSLYYGAARIDAEDFKSATVQGHAYFSVALSSFGVYEMHCRRDDGRYVCAATVKGLDDFGKGVFCEKLQPTADLLHREYGAEKVVVKSCRVNGDVVEVRLEVPGAESADGAAEYASQVIGAYFAEWGEESKLEDEVAEALGKEYTSELSSRGVRVGVSFAVPSIGGDVEWESDSTGEVWVDFRIPAEVYVDAESPDDLFAALEYIYRGG